ncbi:MAG: thioredoxin family protein [Caldiserica bacterium]|nr:thioredoxin family protein [Caldisericota bacterium]
MALLKTEDAQLWRDRFAEHLVAPVTLTLITASDTGVTSIALDGTPPLVNDANRRYLPLAQQFGMVNPLIRAEVIEAGEFPEVADQYLVSSVPKSVMNEDREVIGALPEAEYLREFLSSIGRPD